MIDYRKIAIIGVVFILISVGVAAYTMPQWEKDDGSGGSGGPINPDLPNSASGTATMFFTDSTPNLHGDPPEIHIITADGQNLTGVAHYDVNGTLISYLVDTDGDGVYDMGYIPLDGDSFNTDPDNWAPDTNNNGIPDVQDPDFTYTEIGAVMKATITITVIDDLTGATGGDSGDSGGGGGGGGGTGPITGGPVPTTIAQGSGYIRNDNVVIYASLTGGDTTFTKDKPTVAEAWARLWGVQTIDRSREVPIFVQFVVKDAAGNIYTNNAEKWVSIDYIQGKSKTIAFESLPFPVVNNTEYTLMFSAYVGIPGQEPTGQIIYSGVGDYTSHLESQETVNIGTYTNQFVYNPNGGD